MATIFQWKKRWRKLMSNQFKRKPLKMTRMSSINIHSSHSKLLGELPLTVFRAAVPWTSRLAQASNPNSLIWRMKRLSTKRQRRLSKKMFLTRLNPLPRRWLRLNLKILKIILKKNLAKLMILSSKRTTQSFFINLLKMMSQKMKRLKKETRNLCLVGVLRA